jgi:peptidoglycan/xylan/chitin deacetylase (PgdA/CDA1 family)
MVILKKLLVVILIVGLAQFTLAFILLQLGDRNLEQDKFNQAQSQYNLAHKLFPLVFNYQQRELALDINLKDREGPAEESGGDLPLKFPNQVLGLSVEVPVLMYHYIRINPNPNDSFGYNLSVTPTNFASQMDYLLAHGYHVITLDELSGVLFNRSTLPDKPIVVTFDDGYADCYFAAFPILKKHNFKALNFIITGLVGAPNYLSWSQIEEMKNSGVFTFGDHTVHHYALAYLSSAQVKSELADSKNDLQKHLGGNIKWFAYPYGSVDNRVANLTKEAGFTGAFGTNSGLYQTIFTLCQESELMVVILLRLLQPNYRGNRFYSPKKGRRAILIV